VLAATSCKETSYYLEADKSVYFSSPNFPNKFEHQTQCNWLIIAPRGYRVRLEFQKFYLMSSELRGCVYQKVQIDDLWSDTSDGPYCGNSLPPVLRSTGNRIRVKLQSDSRDVVQFYRGFRIKVTATFEVSSPRIRDESGKWELYKAQKSFSPINSINPVNNPKNPGKVVKTILPQEVNIRNDHNPPIYKYNENKNTENKSSSFDLSVWIIIIVAVVLFLFVVIAMCYNKKRKIKIEKRNKSNVSTDSANKRIDMKARGLSPKSVPTNVESKKNIQKSSAYVKEKKVAPKLDQTYINSGYDANSPHYQPPNRRNEEHSTGNKTRINFEDVPKTYRNRRYDLN